MDVHIACGQIVGLCTRGDGNKIEAKEEYLYTSVLWLIKLANRQQIAVGKWDPRIVKIEERLELRY